MLIKNARIVTRDDVFTGMLRIEDGMIRDVERGTTSAREAEDWDGDYLLPGLIELHTDNLEKHLAPRPGVQWNTDAAFVIHDAQVAAAGITTVFDSLCAHPLLRLASVMDHTPGQRQWHDREQWRRFQERNGKLTDEHVATALAELTVEQERYADAHRREIVARCKRLGIPVASHDDTLIEHVEQAKAEGIVLAEFPTTRIAAEAAREHGISTIMGAPNIVRGGSHSGNVSALELAQADLLDILSSDYVPSSLMTAVFELVHKAEWTLPRAMATVSAEPARTAGLHDRGAIEVGLRADFVRVTMLDTLPVPRATYRAGARIV